MSVRTVLAIAARSGSATSTARRRARSKNFKWFPIDPAFRVTGRFMTTRPGRLYFIFRDGLTVRSLAGEQAYPQPPSYTSR